MNRSTLLRLLAIAAAAMPFVASGEMLYRYVDPSGRIVYSDQPPPPAATQVEPKRLPQNVIETDPVPFAAREAAEKYPVTLYTFECDVCKQAEGLLAKRGVPFKSVIVSEEAGHAKLMALTGQQSAPVLQVGDKQVMTGFNATRWNQMLDEAGYPKTAPPPRQVARSAAASPAPAKPASASAEPDNGGTPIPPLRGTDYPK